MSNVPPDYVKENSFTTLATQPITISGLPGSQLDSEFSSVATSVNQTIDRLSLIQQDDGAIRNGVVGLESLSVDAKNALAVCGAVVRGTWVASTTYEAGDVVVSAADKYAYLCVTTHTSSADFDADFLSNVWAIMGYRPATNDLAVDTFTAGASQTVYTLSTNPVSENNTQVFVNGVYQSKTVYSVSGLVLTLATAPATGAKVEVVTGVAAELINNIVTIPPNSVGTIGIVDLAVTAAKIADATITTGKLADQSVTSAKIENNTVGSTKIADLAIGTDKLVGSAVTTEKLALLSVTTPTIAEGAITTAKIADAQVTTAKIVDGAVTKAKLNADITPSLMPVGAVVAFYRPAWSVPDGWLACDGTTISASKTSLVSSPSGWNDGRAGDFTALVAYMGSFVVPDLRGLFIRGGGTNSSSAMNGVSRDHWTYQDHSIQSHNHSLDQVLRHPGYAAHVEQNQSGGPADYSSYLYSTGYAGGDETRPRNFSLIYCIKY